MHIAVKPMPAMPSREKGARDFRSRSRQRGSSTVDVSSSRVYSRERDTPKVWKRDLNVSASIILYATFAAPVLKVHAAAGSQELFLPTDSDQQER